MAVNQEAPAVAPAEPKVPGALIALSDRGVQLQSMQDLFRFAQAVANSGMAPKGMQRPEQILVAIQTGMEAGLSPMKSLSSVVVIGGVPSWKGDAARALIEASGMLKPGTFVDVYLEVDGVRVERVRKDQWDRDVCGYCETWRRDWPKAHRTPFSIEEAMKAGLWKKAGPWTEYPQRMLMYRALGFHARDHYGSTLLGMRTADETGDIVPMRAEVNVTPRPAAAAPVAAALPAWAAPAAEPAAALPEPVAEEPVADEIPAESLTAYACMHENPELEDGHWVCRNCGEVVNLEPTPEDPAPEPEPPAQGPIDEEQQAQFWIVIRERALELHGKAVTRAQEHKLGERVLLKHGCRETKQLRRSNFADALETARTIEVR